ncbi:MAG: PQQ-binding-like beta-propeller repeat protein [Bacteroidota bacterium]
MENNKQKINIQLWKKIALVAGSFSLIICLLIIANYIQLKRTDPVNIKTINLLVERLSENPDDNELREEIRTLDLLARKAYFTSQWQIRTGGYMVLIGLAIVIIAFQIISSAKGIKPVVSNETEEDFLTTQLLTRRWVSVGGVSIVVISLIFAFLTHNELGNTFAQASSIQKDSLNNTIEKIAETENNELIPEEENESLITDTVIANEESILAVEENKQEATDSANIEKNKQDEKPLSEYPTYKEITQNFPTFRGPGGNGISYHKNIPTSWDGKSGKNILWKLTVPLPGYNSPVIWGDKLFLSGANGKKREVYGIDRHTGKILWTVSVKNVSGSPSQSPKVTEDTGHAAPTVATDGRRVYAIFSNGDIIAIDMDGKKVWARNLGVPSNHYGHSSSLMMFRNMVIVQYDQKKASKVMALAAKTGQTLWGTNRDVKISWASPVVAFTGKQTEIILASDPFVASYNPYSGKENWKIDCLFGEVGPSVAYADGIVYAQNEYARLVAIKLGEKPEILWEDDEYLSDVPSPVATKKYLFNATSYGAVICHDAKTGKKLWEKEFDNGFYSSPIMVEGKIYLIDKKGVMHIFSASDKFITIAEPALGENTDCTPAFADGRIYIRGSKNLYCIGK